MSTLGAGEGHDSSTDSSMPAPPLEAAGAPSARPAPVKAVRAQRPANIAYPHPEPTAPRTTPFPSVEILLATSQQE